MQLVGVDVVGAGLRKAHTHCPRAALLLADVCDLPVGDNSVDAAVSANMLEHVSDDEQALREIHRILRPGGLAACVVPFGKNLMIITTTDFWAKNVATPPRVSKQGSPSRF